MTSETVTYKLEEVVINEVLTDTEWMKQKTQFLSDVLINVYNCVNLRATIEPYHNSNDWSVITVEGDKDGYQRETV